MSDNEKLAMIRKLSQKERLDMMTSLGAGDVKPRDKKQADEPKQKENKPEPNDVKIGNESKTPQKGEVLRYKKMQFFISRVDGPVYTIVELAVKRRTSKIKLSDYNFKDSGQRTLLGKRIFDLVDK